MLTIISNPANILIAQTLLGNRLQETLPQRDNLYTIGYQGGNYKTDCLYANEKFWFVSTTLENRYWNAFGLVSKLNIKTSNNIAVEINIPLNRINRWIAGLFAEDSVTGNTTLLHRGNIGGGRKGIGKRQFLEWYDEETVQVNSSSDSKKSIDDVLFVADLNSSDIASQIGKFVMNVADFKIKM